MNDKIHTHNNLTSLNVIVNRVKFAHKRTGLKTESDL